MPKGNYRPQASGGDASILDYLLREVAPTDGNIAAPPSRVANARGLPLPQGGYSGADEQTPELQQADGNREAAVMQQLQGAMKGRDLTMEDIMNWVSQQQGDNNSPMMRSDPENPYDLDPEQLIAQVMAGKVDGMMEADGKYQGKIGDKGPRRAVKKGEQRVKRKGGKNQADKGDREVADNGDDD